MQGPGPEEGWIRAEPRRRASLRRLPYRSPHLQVYGKVAGITAGGSLGPLEQHTWQVQKQRP